MTFFLPWMHCVLGLEVVLDVDARASSSGRSITWPTEAFTVKSRPRYFLIVFALAGDSTMTRFFAMARFGVEIPLL